MRRIHHAVAFTVGNGMTGNDLLVIADAHLEGQHLHFHDTTAGAIGDRVLVAIQCQMSFKIDPLLSLKNDPPLRSPSRGSGSVKIPKIHPPFHLSSGSIPEAPALVAGLNNFAVMR